MHIRSRVCRFAVIAGCLLTPLAAWAGGRSLLQEMAGTWSVKEWMWPGPGMKALDLPPALAYRQLIDGKFLQERMSALAGSKDAFTRISYLNQNPESGQYEYFSIDTRAPQMMNERSEGAVRPDSAIDLYGGIFVATQWGSATNVPFRYRIVVYPVRDNTQTVELYLTPMPAAQSRSFLAFKYVYTRRPAGR
ncbi:MAG: DUF1579 family protein [Steroidobacteraceae bacterium]